MINTKTSHEIVLHFYSLLSEGKGTEAGNLFSEEAHTLCIGTDSLEWIQGKNRITNIMEKQLIHEKITVQSGKNPVIVEHTNSAWIADEPIVTTENGDKLSARMTFYVYRKNEAEDWKIENLHFSVGIPNRDVFGKDLPLT